MRLVFKNTTNNRSVNLVHIETRSDVHFKSVVVFNEHGSKSSRVMPYKDFIDSFDEVYLGEELIVDIEKDEIGLSFVYYFDHREKESKMKTVNCFLNDLWQLTQNPIEQPQGV